MISPNSAAPTHMTTIAFNGTVVPRRPDLPPPCTWARKREKGRPRSRAKAHTMRLPEVRTLTVAATQVKTTTAAMAVAPAVEAVAVRNMAMAG